MTTELKFPIIIFEKDDRKMYALDYKFLMGDIRYIDVAFKNVEVIDSKGSLYKLKGVKKASGIKILESLKLVGLIVKLEPLIDGEVGSVSLSFLKERALKQVSSNSKYWLSIDTVEGMKARIDSAESFEELIRIFR